jgi:predicted NAD/FAD-dependent oxidoreductase
VDDCRHLLTYRIPHALPAQAPPALSPVEKPARRSPGLYVCGDYLDTASIQGAMASGRRAAEAVLKDRS